MSIRSRTFLLALGLILATLVAFYIYTSQKDPSPSHEISVILRENQNGIWDSTLRGMEQAARDTNAILNVLYIPDTQAVAHDIPQIQQEMESGVQAIILAPCESAVKDDELKSIARNVVLVQIEAQADESLYSVAPDNRQMGIDLASIAIEDGLPPGSHITLVSLKHASQATIQREKGLLDTLEAAGMSVEQLKVEAATLGFMESMRARFTDVEQPVVFAMDARVSLAVGYSIYDMGIPDARVYAIGNNTGVHSMLENYVLERVLAPNTYGQGYLAVKTAVQALEGKNPPLEQIIPFFSVCRDNLFEEETQFLLFPFIK